MEDAIGTLAKCSSDLRAEHEKYIFPCAKPYYREPVVMARAKGVWVRDVGGSEYLDLFAGILTTSIGHCHPAVVERVREQVGSLGHTSSLYLNEQQIEAARRLSTICPGGLQSSFFTNSGTEAVETAIMLAQLYTGRQEVIALRYAYSGRSALATNLSGQAPWRPVSSLIPNIKHAISPYPYRGPFDPSDPELGRKYAQDIEEVIQTSTSGRPAAFFAETIQGSGGYIVPPPGYFQAAAEIIRGYGGLFISDEVQAGFGRTGDKWFGIEHWEVEPDIMVMAKGIANGFPVGATITRPQIAAAWTAKTISTYGGNPVAMAATDATLKVMMDEDVPARAARRGKQLRDALEDLQRQHAWIGEVRGMGLMQALELVEERRSKKPASTRALALMEASKEEGLLLGLGGLHAHVIRIGPSLLISEEELGEGLKRLRRACGRVGA